jgi:hypothetical protein
MASSLSSDPDHGAGGAEPTGEPHGQDTAGGGRGVGLSLTTVLAAVLIAVPVAWAVLYLTQAASIGASGGFLILIAIVLAACMSVGWLLLRGMFRT